MSIAQIYWDINPEISSVFGLSLRYYGLLFGIGLVLSYLILRGVFHREGFTTDYLDNLAFLGIIGMIIGARLAHCLFYEPEYFLSRPLEMLLPIGPSPNGGYMFTGYQGLASHGGVGGAFLVVYLYVRRAKQPFFKTIDLFAIIAPLAGAFIRLANLMNSEIVGSPTNAAWAFIFVQYDGVPRHPAQLYEAMAYLICFAVVLYAYRKYYSRLGSGFLFGLSLSLAFLARFIIEFFKEHHVPFEETLWLNMGQILSIPMVLLGVGFMWWGWRRTEGNVK